MGDVVAAEVLRRVLRNRRGDVKIKSHAPRLEHAGGRIPLVRLADALFVNGYSGSHDQGAHKADARVQAGGGNCPLGDTLDF